MNPIVANRVADTDILCGMCGGYHVDVLAVKLCHAEEYLSGEDDFQGKLRHFLGEDKWRQLEEESI